MKLADECPECLTKSMALAYDIDGIGDVEYCTFCGDGWTINESRRRVTLSTPGRSQFGLWPNARPVVLSELHPGQEDRRG